MTMRERQKDRAETNPALSTRRLKLGTFQTNLDSGCVMSELDGRLDITWDNTVALAQLAAEMEFEALVPVAPSQHGPRRLGKAGWRLTAVVTATPSPASSSARNCS